MIRLTRPGPQPGVVDRTWIRWRDDCDKATKALIQHHEHQGALAEVEKNLYRRKSIIKKYYHNRKAASPIAPFHGKCASSALERLAVSPCAVAVRWSGGGNRRLAGRAADAL